MPVATPTRAGAGRRTHGERAAPVAPESGRKDIPAAGPGREGFRDGDGSGVPYGGGTVGSAAAGPCPPVSAGGRRMACGLLGRVHEMVSAPDGSVLAVASHDGRLLLVGTGGGERTAGNGDEASGAAPDTASDAGADADDAVAAAGRVTELARSDNGPVRDLAFSPDSAWLAWSHPGIGRSLRLIKLSPG